MRKSLIAYVLLRLLHSMAWLEEEEEYEQLVLAWRLQKFLPGIEFLTSGGANIFCSEIARLAPLEMRFIPLAVVNESA